MHSPSRKASREMVKKTVTMAAAVAIADDHHHQQQPRRGSQSQIHGKTRKLSITTTTTAGPSATSDQLAATGESTERVYRRVYPDRETTFTDKDRAAAVAMGSRDIKVSLQVKRKREKRHDEPGEREFRIRFALANQELRTANPSRALHFVCKALEMRPKSRECFVVRSKCHLLLGHLQAALEDADTALGIDTDYVKGIYAKAEALYALGDFEHALVYYHRGHHQRLDAEEFRLGIQKAEEAILNAIYYNKENKCSSPSTGGRHSRTSSSSAAERVQKATDLQPDIEFLTKLLEDTEIRNLSQPDNHMIEEQVNEVLDFLRSRQEFWSQQRPTKHT